jgi:hypothetical protein
MANTQLQDSFKIPYAIFETDADSNVAVPGAGDSVGLSSSDIASLTVLPDAAVDPAKVPNNADGTPGDPTKCLQTGFLVGGSKAQAGVKITAVFAHADGTQAPANVVDLFDIVVGPATTGVIALGTPVAQ